jgi:hypothetical protein
MSCVSPVLMTTLLRSMLPLLTRGNVFVSSHSENKAFWWMVCSVGEHSVYRILAINKVCHEVPPHCQPVIYQTHTPYKQHEHHFPHWGQHHLMLPHLNVKLHVWLSSAYCSDLLLHRETLNTVFTVQESSHLHLWVLMYSEVSSYHAWEVLWFSSDRPSGKYQAGVVSIQNQVTTISCCISIHYSSYVHLLYEPENTLFCVSNVTDDETCVWMSHWHMNSGNTFNLASSTILVMMWLCMSPSFPY